MDKRACEARREDSNRLSRDVLGYIPNLSPGLDSTNKGDRGWNNKSTARLLCPQNKLSEFDENWES